VERKLMISVTVIIALVIMAGVGWGLLLAQNNNSSPVAPGAPTQLTARVSDDSVILNWLAPSDPGSGISGYNIFRFDAPGMSGGTRLAALSGSPSEGPLANSWADVGLSSGTYYYTVYAFNEAGQGPSSNEVVTMVDMHVPAQTIKVGDYITYSETLGSLSYTMRIEYTAVSEDHVTVHWEYSNGRSGSGTYTCSFTMENGIFKCPFTFGAWNTSPDLYKTGETDISTRYGTKQVNVYYYYQHNAIRTIYSPEDCFIYFYQTGDIVNGGDHFTETLIETNIQWLRNT
jgi:hypothetical protein